MPQRLSPEFLNTCGDPVVVASYMRSGTHLTIDFLRRNLAGFDSYKLPIEANDSLYLPIDALIARAWSPRRTQSVLRRAERIICKTHWCDPEFEKLVDSPYSTIGLWLRERAKVILVHRDPCRTIESLVIWRLFTGEFSRPEIPAGLWLSERLHEWVARVRSWQQTTCPLLAMSSDDLLTAPEDALTRIADFVGTQPRPQSPILPPQLRGSWHSRLNRMFSMRPQSTEVLTFRPAPAIPWSAQQLRLVERICGDLCHELGYDLSGYLEPNPVRTVRAVRSTINTSSQGEK